MIADTRVESHTPVSDFRQNAYVLRLKTVVRGKTIISGMCPFQGSVFFILGGASRG